MVPTTMFLAVLFVSIMIASFVNFYIGQYVERKRHEVKVNVFDAYSDEELAKQRKFTAEQVRRYNHSHYYKANFERAVLYLSQIDREIANRKALEQSHVSQARRELAAFDIVFAELENKEKK